MEDPNNTLQFEDVSSISHYDMYENIENIAPNDQSVQCSDDGDDNYGEENHSMEINDNKCNLRENLEEANTQTNSEYKLLQDSHTKYSDCGEPLKSQHIKIDFTPIPGIDDDAFLQQKCVDFWKFVNEHPKLQSFKIEKVNLQTGQSSANRTNLDQDSQEMEVPAVKFLKRPGTNTEYYLPIYTFTDIQIKGLATKLKYTLCGHSGKDYIPGETKVEQNQVKLKKRSNFSGPQSSLGSKSKSGIKNKPTIIKSRGLDDVIKLCHKMEEWDLSHPKSMDPPKRVRSLKDLN